MGDRLPRVSSVAARRTIIALGGIFVVLTAGQAARYVHAVEPALDILGVFLLVGIPGMLVLYVGYKLPETSVTQVTYPRVLAWALGGFGLLLAVVGILVLSPGFSIDNAGWSVVLATAIGTVAGTAIGFNEARALSRAHEAEDARRKLEETVERLEASNEQLDQFASMVSHDLQTPLSIASGKLSLYRDSGDDSHLDDLERALQRIDELTQGLLTLVRTDEKTGVHESVSLEAVARDAWTMIDSLSASLETEDTMVAADRGQLQALFENIFRNAVGHGGADVTVRVGPTENGFYVEDTGQGIPPEERGQVFEHGFSTGYGGNGVGLTIVSRIAQAHDWNVSIAESAEGGARFEFCGVDSA